MEFNVFRKKIEERKELLNKIENAPLDIKSKLEERVKIIDMEIFENSKITEVQKESKLFNCFNVNSSDLSQRLKKYFMTTNIKMKRTRIGEGIYFKVDGCNHLITLGVGHTVLNALFRNSADNKAWDELFKKHPDLKDVLWEMIKEKMVFENKETLRAIELLIIRNNQIIKNFEGKPWLDSKVENLQKENSMFAEERNQLKTRIEEVKL